LLQLRDAYSAKTLFPTQNVNNIRYIRLSSITAKFNIFSLKTSKLFYFSVTYFYQKDERTLTVTLQRRKVTFSRTDVTSLIDPRVLFSPSQAM